MEILKNYFNKIQISKDGVVLDTNTLNQIKESYTNLSKLKSENIILEKPYGIFALVNNYLGVSRIVTFHYFDFRWYPISTTAKIMHKSNIEEWRDKETSHKFSENPHKNSGDVLGIMSGDFRDCFNEIIIQENERQLLFNGTVEILLNDGPREVEFQSGKGLQSLTLLEKITNDNPQRMGLHFIS